MNNLNFGNDKYQYYETICSGSPAGPGFDGTDAVHTHMTNTRLTDPEVLEFRYPVVLEDFHIRKDSGGRGKWHAGDGIRRTIRFLEKMDCTILSGHRRVPPFGLAGGEDGQVGENWVRRKDGTMERLQGLRRDRDRRRRGGHHPDADGGRIREGIGPHARGASRLDHEAAAPHPSRRTLAELALRPASGHKRTCGGKGRRRLSDICPPARQTVRCKQSFESCCLQRP